MNTEKISKITCGEEAKLHVLCMIEELPKLEIGKFNRWLGFIQGYLWTEGIYTIDELREHNIWLKK